jgi:hypothetical protein
MTWPKVTEQPLRLEPTSKDTFLDGLAGDGARATTNAAPVAQPRSERCAPLR